MGATFDDFKAGFKMFHGRDYDPVKDSEMFKEYPVTLTCKDCETQNPAKYLECIKSISSTGEWKPLCPEQARSLKHGQKKSIREDTKESDKLEELSILFGKGKRIYKPGRQKK